MQKGKNKGLSNSILTGFHLVYWYAFRETISFYPKFSRANISISSVLFY